MTKKVLHILKSVGGVEVIVKMIVNHLDADKVENIIVHDDESKTYFDTNNTKLKSFRLPIKREVSLLDDYRCVIGLIKIVKSERPSVIHCHSAKAGLIGRIVGAITKTSVLYTPHAFSYLSAENKLKKWLYLTIERYTKFQKNTKLLAISNSEKERGVNEVKYSPENVFVWHNSIKPIEIEVEKPSDKFISLIGRPSYQKNIEMMVRAIELVKIEISTIKLKIIGVGYHSPNIKALETLISELNLKKNIDIIAWGDRVSVLKEIKRSEFLVSTARYEGLPLALIEALSLGKPCVVTEVDGNKDLITDSYNGFLVDNEDHIALAQKIILLCNDEELKKKLSSNALNSFLKKFNIEENIKYLEEIYEGV